MIRRGRRQRVNVGAIIRKWVKRNHFEPEVDESLLRLRWSHFVGEKVSAHTRPSALHKGVLKITVESSAWLNELSFLRGDLIRTINSTFGRRVVTEIRLLSGPLDPSLEQEAREKRGRRAPVQVDEALVARAAADLPDVGDEDLSRAIARARAAQLGSEEKG